MKLNHLNLYVPDVNAASRFFVDHFGLKVKREVPGKMSILEDEAGFVLNLGHLKPVDFSYPDFLNFHVGFKQRTREDVDRIHANLTAAELAPPEPHEFHGAWTFYLRCPGGFFVEVYCQER
jgi:catechol 2,3-dioxygenase-like lactoylglutathione lyase family enzyme